MTNTDQGNERGALPHGLIDELRMGVEVLSPKEMGQERERAEILLNKFIEMFGEYIPDDTREEVLSHEPASRITVVSEEAFTEIFRAWDGEEVSTGSVFSEVGMHYYVTSVLTELDVERDSDDEVDNRIVDYYLQVLDKYGEDVHKVFFGRPVEEEKKKLILAEFTQDLVGTLLPDVYKEHLEHVPSDERVNLEDARAMAIRPDLLIVIKDESNALNERVTGKARRKLIERLSSVEEARFVAKEIALNNNVLHEMIHLFEQ